MDVDSVTTIVRSVLRTTLSYFDEDDRLLVDVGPDRIRIAYVSAQASAGSCDCTCMQCQIHVDVDEMWIADLRIAAPLRLLGLGRQLVTALEQIARETATRRIKVLPFPASVPFWRKMGYEPDLRTARVLSKDLSWQYVTHNGRRQMESAL